MTKVVPAIHVASPEEYRDQLRVVRQLTSRFQLDVIDPDFADSPTVSMTEIEVPIGMQCDVHIMSPNPGRYMEDALALKPEMIIVQYETVENVEEILEAIRSHEVRVGLAINPETSIEHIASLVGLIDHCLIMGYPAGRAGQTFQPKGLHKVAQVRQLKPTIEVGLDGGVAEESLERIAKANFDVVNVTTYLFSSQDILGRYTELMEVFV